MTDGSVMRDALGQQLIYLNTNVWWCTILHKDCLMEAVSLMQLWNNKRIQNFVLLFCIIGPYRSDSLKKEWPNHEFFCEFFGHTKR